MHNQVSSPFHSLIYAQLFPSLVVSQREGYHVPNFLVLNLLDLYPKQLPIAENQGYAELRLVVWSKALQYASYCDIDIILGPALPSNFLHSHFQPPQTSIAEARGHKSTQGHRLLSLYLYKKVCSCDLAG